MILETTAEALPEPEERVEVDGKIRSYLTGEMKDVSQANRRPIAVMMENDKAGLPPVRHQPRRSRLRSTGGGGYEPLYGVD